MGKNKGSQNWRWWFGVTFFCAAALPLLSQTTWTWPGCPNVTDGNFSYTTLVQHNNTNLPDPGLSEPADLDFDMDVNGNVDVYYVEIRPGNVKRYNAAAKTMTLLANLPNWKGPYEPVTNGGNIEEGLTGIVLDPDFKTNHWLYIHWSPASASVFRISRFTVTGNTLGSEKIILDIPAQRSECCHTGGGMAFDAYGDLWIAQGSNSGRGTNVNPTEGINETTQYESEEWGSSSTHGLRGSILRIHPDNSTKGYSIPSGNFGEYFAAQTGNNQYLDTSKVLPEIFTKGSRNCYRLSVDPVRRWVLWGDVGPDVMTTTVREELDLRKTPAFMGWPYFVGNNTVFSYSTSPENPATPTNTSKWNTGLTSLPPALPAIVVGPNGGGATPIGGPLYRYDGDLNSTVKLPPHFTRKWFSADYSNSEVWVNTLDSLGHTVTAQQQIFTTASANGIFSGPVALKAGPDGALYIVNYCKTNFSTDNTTSIVKIAYTGTCRPADPKLEQPVGVSLNPDAHYVTEPAGWVVNLGSNRPVMVPNGMTGFELFDLMGRKVWGIKNLRSGQSFTFPAGLQRGALKYRWVPTI